MTDDELRRLFDALQQETAAIRQDNAAMRQENAAGWQDNAARWQENAAKWQENAAAHVQTRRHFDVAVERLEKRFDTLAESVQYLDEKLDRKCADLEERMEHGFTETQAMIKFSHAELDRRMRTLEGTQRTLEDAVAGLQARVERLESSTH